MNAKSMVKLQESMRAWDALTRNQKTMVRLGGSNLALFQITEWYENILMLSVVALFILNKNPWSIPAAILVVLAAYFLEILIDNTSARMKSGKMLELSWAVTIAAAGVNLLILILVR